MQNTSDMLQATYIVLAVIYIFYNNTVSAFESFYGVSTDEYPKSSCQAKANIESRGRCLGICGISMDRIAMISHDKSTKICMCCNNFTGSDIIGSIGRHMSHVSEKFIKKEDFVTNPIGSSLFP